MLIWTIVATAGCIVLGSLFLLSERRITKLKNEKEDLEFDLSQSRARADERNERVLELINKLENRDRKLLKIKEKIDALVRD